MRSTDFVVARNDLQQCKVIETELPDTAALPDEALLVKVTRSSPKAVVGRTTWASLAVSVRNRCWTTTRSASRSDFAASPKKAVLTGS